jgi:hypothetical protein
MVQKSHIQLMNNTNGTEEPHTAYEPHLATSAINLNDRMKRIWKEMVLTLFKVLYSYLPRGTEENHETSVRITCL